MPAKIELVGKRFGKLVVVSQVGLDKWGQYLWDCKCDCGNDVKVTGGNLRNRKEKNSCGCVKTQRLKDTFTKHGHTVNKAPTREYRSWQGMKKRCLDSTHVYYHHYGGRGITICDRWLNSFENFLSDMGPRPPKTTLDRIDVNWDYLPDNCRWATWQEQARNKRPKIA